MVLQHYAGWLSTAGCMVSDLASIYCCVRYLGGLLSCCLDYSCEWRETHLGRCCKAVYQQATLLCNIFPNGFCFSEVWQAGDAAFSTQLMRRSSKPLHLQLTFLVSCSLTTFASCCLHLWSARLTQLAPGEEDGCSAASWLGALTHCTTTCNHQRGSVPNY